MADEALALQDRQPAALANPGGLATSEALPKRTKTGQLECPRRYFKRLERDEVCLNRFEIPKSGVF